MLIQRLKDWKWELATLFLWGSYFIALFARMLSIQPDGLYMGHENLWSDWASLHIGMANIFAHKPPKLWFAYHTVFADGKLTYAFLTNLVSAMFMRAGLSLEFSFLMPSMIFSAALVLIMHRVYSVALGSKKLAFLAVSVFFLSAGLGFAEHFAQGRFFDISSKISALPSYDWLEGNFIIGMLLPQRAFLLGMPLALYGLYAILATTNGLPMKKGKLFVAGVCIGLLPIAHMHSLIALAILLLPLVLASRKSWNRLVYLIGPAASLSISLFLVFVRGGIQRKGFMSFAPGLSTHGLVDWVSFWWRAWGVTIPLALGGFILCWRSSARVFFSGFFLLFFVADVIQFQPTRWDNSKLFLWVYFGFAALSVKMLAWLWSHRLKHLSRPAAAALFISLTLTGFLQLFDLQQVEHHTYRLLSSDEMALAEAIREKTDPLARFATAFVHDHPISVWAARPVLLGYRSWADNYGFSYQEIERDVTAIYQASPATPDLLRKHRISYVYFGPAEAREFQADEKYFQERFPVAFRSPSGLQRVYDVRSVSSVNR